MPSTKSRTILAVLVVIIAVSACHLFFYVRQQHENQQLLVEARKELVTTLVAAFTDELDRQYSSRIRSFALNRGEIMRHLADRDRQGLYAATLPVYRVLKEENRYFDRITYILPDNSVFLEMRGAAEGDAWGAPPGQAGNEAGPAGNGFIYEEGDVLYIVAHPVYHRERFVGRVLFGIKAESVVEEVKKNLGMHTALAVRPEIIQESGNDQPRKGAGGYYLYDFGDSFFADRRLPLGPGGQVQLLNQDQTIHVVFPSYFIRGAEGDEIGFIYQAVDVTPIMSSYRQNIVRLTLITLTIIAAAALILYRSFNTIYDRMVGLYGALEEKNRELDRAGRRLEQEVAERTAELAETNRRLNEEMERRKDATLSLARSVEEWQITFDAIKDPVTILDKDLTVVIANKAAQEMLSRGNRELVGRTCHELFADSPDRCAFCPANSLGRGRTQEYEIEHKAIGKTLLICCAPICEGGETIGYVHTAKDVTEEKNLKRQLFQVQKMEAIATLAGGIAHDFNNILGAILGNADLLLFRLAGKGGKDAEQRNSITIKDVEGHVQAIKKAGNRAKDLVSQILAFSRQGMSRRQNAVIAPVIKEGVKLLRATLPAKIEIREDLAPETCPVYADLSQVHQVFMNLCTNAAQAMAGKGGILTVTLRGYVAKPPDRKVYPDLKPGGRYVALEVKDTGHGMSQEIMERIFDPFFTTRDVGEGTGMGLAVIHGIITAHEGVLDVKSEVGAGSVFTVFFPCIDEKVNGREDVLIHGMPQGNERILFIDDEVDIVRMISRMLEYLGYTVYSSTSAEEALSMLRDNPGIDLVITDYSMPGISGIEMAKEIGRMRPGLPVMLCSGFSESVLNDGEARGNIRRFMSKPIDMKELAVAIREVMSVSDGKYDADPDY